MTNDWINKIEIRKGDIARMDVDAVFNAANNDLALGSGVAGAIASADDGSIQRECDAHGPVLVGGAAITSGGALKCRWVVHAASMGYAGGRMIRTTKDTLAGSLRRGLGLAMDQGAKSVAIPAIGTGVSGFPIEICARITLDVVSEHLEFNSKLEKVVLAAFDESAAGAFQEALDERQ